MNIELKHILLKFIWLQAIVSYQAESLISCEHYCMKIGCMCFISVHGVLGANCVRLTAAICPSATYLINDKLNRSLQLLLL